MNKLEKLHAAIETISPEHEIVKKRMRNVLDAGDLHMLRAYVCGAYDTAYHLTSDRQTLSPLIVIRELLT